MERLDRFLRRTVPAVALLAALASGAARAQINAPAPPLMGQPSTHLYTVPGARAFFNALRTVILCSNTSGAPIRVGVEVFDAFGGPALNDASLGSWELPPGGSRTFTTGFVQEFSVGSSDVSIPTPVAFLGSARILATRPSGVICSALLSDAVGSPPASMVTLTIVKKTKQKGD